jgi:ketosteroid isomerase-like protein
MPSENVELVRRAYDAFNREGVEAVLRFFDRDVKVEYRSILLDAEATYHGYDGVRKLTRLLEENVVLRAEVDELIDAGDDVVVVADWRARGRKSGADTVIRTGQVLSLRDGVVVRWQLYGSRAAALEAVGLSARE